MKKLFFLCFVALLFGVGIFLADTMYKNRPTLKKAIEQAMNGRKGEYAIVIKHFKTGEAYEVNEHKLFNTASLYKLWVMAEAFAQIKEGTIKEDDMLSGDIATLNEEFSIDTDGADLREGRIEMTVSQALHQMITISHNYAALLLSEKLKNSHTAQFLTANKFNESNLGSDGAPKSTASDSALFFEKLYRGELVDRKSSQKMLDILKKQKFNDGLPKYLPKNVAIAHKTGEIDWFKHDAGIVFTKKGDYIIVVLSESDFPPGAQERIALLSKTVYEYFNRDRFLGFL